MKASLNYLHQPLNNLIEGAQLDPNGNEEWPHKKQDIFLKQTQEKLYELQAYKLKNADKSAFIKINRIKLFS